MEMLNAKRFYNWYDVILYAYEVCVVFFYTVNTFIINHKKISHSWEKV